MASYNITYEEEKCIISDLRLSKDEKFEVFTQPENITNLRIEKSTIPRLTEDLLGAFTNLEKFWGQFIGIEEVSEDAFVGCKNLVRISLEGNKIKSLEPNTFNRNTKLEALGLFNNQLECLPKEIFLNLNSLNCLELGGNNLTSLSKKLFTNLKNLLLLYVFSNQLMDLKIEEILKQCPKLKMFFINDNNFSHAVLEKILKHLNDAGVDRGISYTVRTRPYATQKLDEVEYIPDDEYEKLLAKKEATKLKKTIKQMHQQMEAMNITMKQLQTNGI